MLEAAFWGFVGGFALLVGAVVGLKLPTSQRTIGLIMAFGAGVLISALAFELTDEAYRRGGVDAVAFGIAAGSVAFFIGDWIVDHRGGQHRKRSGGEQSGGSGTVIVIGALMDGIPESVAIGVSLLGGGAVGASVVAAVFLSNVPESLSAATGLQKAGRSPRYILGLWTAVVAVSALASMAGYAFGERVGQRGRRHPGVRSRRDLDDAGRHDDARGVRAWGEHRWAADGARLLVRVHAVSARLSGGGSGLADEERGDRHNGVHGDELGAFQPVGFSVEGE